MSTINDIRNSTWCRLGSQPAGAVLTIAQQQQFLTGATPSTDELAALARNYGLDPFDPAAPVPAVQPWCR